MLKKFNEGKSKAVFNIITGDETCIYNFDPETKLQSTLWCSSKSPPPKKIRRAQSVGKQMVRSRPRAQLRGVLRHDNARLHTLAQTLDFLAKSGVQLVTHPPYSPDLAPCDFFYFQKLMQEVLKLKKHIKTLEEKNAYYQNLLRKAGISTEEVWDENLHRCPQKPTLDQASALLKRLENGGLPNGLSRSKKTHVQQTSQQLAQSHHVQQNQQSAQQVVQHQLPGQQQRAVQHQPFGQHRVLQTQTQPAQLNVQQQLPSQSHQTIFSTKKVDRSRPTPEPAEVIIEQGTLSSMATGTTTVMTQALPQIPVMSTNPAAPPPIQMTAGGSGPSLIVINDNGIPILHNVVTFQNSPIILNSASSSPLLAPAATNFSDSSPCVSKDMGPPPQRIASAPSVPTTGPSEVIIRPQSADTMKQVPGSSSSTITFSSTPLQPLLSPATHVLPTAAPADSARMQLVTGGMIGFNQQQGSLYSTGPPTLPTALILPNGQIIPVVSQPSLMYPNLTWTNKISSLVKPPPPLPPQLPITRPAAPISEINCPKNIAKKIQMQKKIPASTELSALPEADRLAKLVAASNTTTNTTASLTEGEICKNKVPLRNIKSAPAPKKCTINIKPQPSTTKITTSVNSSQSSAAPPVSSTEIQKSIDSLPPPLIEPELVPTSVNRSTNDILAQATESIFSPTELSPPTLTQEAHIECSLSKDKELERHKDNNDIISAEKSHDLLSSITASVFSGTISTEDIYVEAITSHSTPENTVKDSSDSTNTKRFRPFTTEPTQGKRNLLLHLPMMIDLNNINALHQLSWIPHIQTILSEVINLPLQPLIMATLFLNLLNLVGLHLADHLAPFLLNQLLLLRVIQIYHLTFQMLLQILEFNNIITLLDLMHAYKTLHHNYIPSSTSSTTSQRYELGINSASGKLDQHSQNNLNKIPSPAKPSKSNSKKSKQQAPTDNTASINVPSLPFDNNRNNSAGLSYFPVPDLSGTSKHDSFGNPRYFSSSQRLPNDQSGRMGPAPHHHRPPHPPPPPPESYNQLFKPQAPDPSLKFQTTSFGMPAPSGSGGQPHVPNFNLSNIFQDIGGPDAIGFSPMKFPSSLTPQSSQVMETQAPQPRSGAYHPRYPPPAPFHSHTPSFGNMIPTLNFPPH
ncbi:hypothetical protein LAZ67_X003712 [Cordylochernes scorpioides]|uniref:Uncharacterized protein n=1 Tax=Cordylochernes scorpioides TaxID=51811 RepID=A0ABY6LUC5_9ARAC|nr:hypothetical protein LAZ67_X003712 [Cordylochernes scorpioides]